LKEGETMANARFCLTLMVALGGLPAHDPRSQEPPRASVPSSVAAVPPHAHKAAHGGIVTDVGQDRHFELVVEGGQFSIYVLDGNEALLPVTGMTAGAEILVKGQERRPVPLTISGDHFTGAQAMNPAGRTTIIVTVKADGKSMIGRFVWLPAGAP
jgi:hypothetical protein